MGKYYTLTDDYEQMQRDTETQPTYRKQLNQALLDFCKKAGPLLDEGNDLQANNNTGYFNARIMEIRDEVDNLRSEARSKCVKAYTDYLDRLESAFKLYGKDIDINVVNFLDPQKVKLTQSEFDRLVEPYLGNHVMEAVFRTYAEKMELAFSPTRTAEEKAKIAKKILDDAESYIGEDQGWAISDWVISMKGELFKSANILTE